MGGGRRAAPDVLEQHAAARRRRARAVHAGDRRDDLQAARVVAVLLGCLPDPGPAPAALSLSVDFTKPLPASSRSVESRRARAMRARLEEGLRPSRARPAPDPAARAAPLADTARARVQRPAAQASLGKPFLIRPYNGGLRLLRGRAVCAAVGRRGGVQLQGHAIARAARGASGAGARMRTRPGRGGGGASAESSRETGSSFPMRKSVAAAVGGCQYRRIRVSTGASASVPACPGVVGGL